MVHLLSLLRLLPSRLLIMLDLLIQSDFRLAKLKKIFSTTVLKKTNLN